MSSYSLQSWNLRTDLVEIEIPLVISSPFLPLDFYADAGRGETVCHFLDRGFLRVFNDQCRTLMVWDIIPQEVGKTVKFNYLAQRIIDDGRP